MFEMLNKIDGVKDLKQLTIGELKILAEDIREALFNRLTKVGGHCGPNFGIVELEIALHYVFNSPKDKFVFDVSHQTYTHKMLTGRRLGFTDEEHFAEESAYSDSKASEHDHFNVGHTSTSISLATGLAKARDVNGRKENVIAIIGDGSLSGGEALEGLNVAGSEINSNLIIIVNDNQQSISETHGGLYNNLKLLRESNGLAEVNFFKSWGLDYIYEANGNDLPSLIKLFRKVKDIDHPIVVHVNTQKGKGFGFAEKNKEAWHSTTPFDRESGRKVSRFRGENYTLIAKEFILNKAKEDDKVVVITPNMPSSMALLPEERRALGSQFMDVGIAEEHASGMASGIAKGGGKPLIVTNMSFMQRAYDQISQDICINNSPVTILLNFTSFAGLTDATHLGIFGISAFSNIPNLVMLCPSSKSELLNMLNWSIDQNEHPVMILLPGNDVTDRLADENYDEINKFKIERLGEKVAIIALGDFYQRAEDFAKDIEKELGICATLINPRFATGVDEELLEALKINHDLVLTFEDGILDGGFGQKIASFYGDSDMKVKNYGLRKEFYDRYKPEELLVKLGICSDAIIQDIKNILN